MALLAPLFCCGGMAVVSALSSSQRDITALPPAGAQKSTPAPTSLEPKKMEDLSKLPVPIAFDETDTPASNGPSEAALQTASPPALSDSELYKRLDEDIGLPIHDLLTDDVARKLHSLGFAADGPRTHPNGRPDSPEWRITVLWYFEQVRDKVQINVELWGDIRGRLRAVEFNFTSQGAPSVTETSRATLKELIPLLNLPPITRYVLEKFGGKSEQTIDSVLVETFAPSPFAHLVT
jgi:hypothetical protein